MLGFNWLKTQTPAPVSPPSAEAIPLQQQILQHCQQPITLGDLSDRVGHSYRDLSPILVKLLGDRQIKIVFLPRDGYNCLHYVTYEHPAN